MRRVIKLLAEQQQEQAALLEFDGKPLTAKRFRTRCKGSNTRLTNALNDTLRCHAHGLLSNDAVTEMVGPVLEQLEGALAKRGINP
jgi:hypothetical protein